MNWRNFLFSFSGRVNRAKQWLIFVLLLIPGLIQESVLINTFGLNWMEFSRIITFQDLQNASAVKVLMLMIPLWLVTAVPSLAVGVKRLHDRNRSGWWIILFLYAPWAFSVFQSALLPSIGHSETLVPTLATTLSSLVVFGIGLWGFIELYCLRGTVGPNRFGPDPLGAPIEQVFE